MTKEKRIHTTSLLQFIHLEPTIDDTVHVVDPEQVTMSEDQLKVWGFLMTQDNLKTGLWKFEAKGATTAINELIQLHIMDTWMAMDPSKLLRED
jgi:hypothetical protein